MPSHIFTRVGYWKESISSNTESARAAKASNEAHDQLHAMDYLVYAYLQTGQDTKAEAVMEEMREVSSFSETFIAGPYALAVSRHATRLSVVIGTQRRSSLSGPLRWLMLKR
jgi:hypothetical protein